MDNNIFTEIVNNRIDRCKEVLVSKAKEYAPGEDRLQNFKDAADMDKESTAKALWGMWKKHIISIRDIVAEMERDPSYVPSKALIAEKIGDNINYSLLLEAVVEERRDGKISKVELNIGPGPVIHCVPKGEKP